MTEPDETGWPVIEPVVRWPRSAVSGQDYLVEVDLRIPASADPPPGDVTFSFFLDGAPYIRVRSAGEPVVTITDPDRTTGPARFVITPRGPAGRRALRLTLCSSRGLPLRVDHLAVIVSVPAGRPDADPPASASWSRAEAFSAQAMNALRLAEEAAAAFRSGRDAMRLEFKGRGLSVSEADIRWSGSVTARAAESEMKWQSAIASMYSRAATVQYARAKYLGGAAEAERIAAIPGERGPERE